MLVHCLAMALLAPQQPQAPEDYWRQRLAELARPDAGQCALAPTGARLWAGALEPRPGFRGVLHYLGVTPELVDPLTVELTDGAGESLSLRVVDREWQPTHSTVRYALGEAGELLEQRWITEDDVLVARLAVRGVPEFGVSWDSPFARLPGGRIERFQAVPMAGLANEHLLDSDALRIGTDSTPIFIEAEDYERQVGSRGPEPRPAASGRRVLGADFGSQRGDEASYVFMGTGVGSWTLVARYARTDRTPAAFEVGIRGQRRGELVCPPSGGRGDQASEFEFATVDLGEIAKGRSELRLTALGDAGGTAFDGFLLVPTERVADLPPREQWSRLDPMRGGVSVPGGLLHLRGVPLALLPPVAPQGIRGADIAVPVPGRGGRLHVLAIPVGDEARILVGDRSIPVGPRRALRDSLVSIDVPAEGSLELATDGCVLIAATREVIQAGGDVRNGQHEFLGIPTEVHAGIHGLDRPWRVAVPEGETVVFHACVEFTGGRVAGPATRAALVGDSLAAHRERTVAWFAARAPRLHTEDVALRKVWAYRWVLLRHHLARFGVGALDGGEVVALRHGPAAGRVTTATTAATMSELRWLADPRAFGGNLNAMLGQPGDARFADVDVTGVHDGGAEWIACAMVDGLLVHPDRSRGRRVLPRLAAALEAPSPPGGLAEAAFRWAGAVRVGALAKRLGHAEIERRMAELAARSEKLFESSWNADEGWFAALDDRGAPVVEASGIYPFAFGLVERAGDRAKALRRDFETAPFAGMAVGDLAFAVDALGAGLRGADRPAVEVTAMTACLRRNLASHFETGNLDGELVPLSLASEPLLTARFLDLFLRHAAGLMPRPDGVLEVRPIAVGFDRFRVEDVPYRGHRVGLRVEGRAVEISVDDRPMGVGSTKRGISLSGILR